MLLAEDRLPLPRPDGVDGPHAHRLDARLAPPSALPRRLVLAGTALGLAGVAALTAALVRGILVGFGDPAASGGLAPSLPVAVALTVGGGLLVHVGLLFARADGRPR